MNAVSIEHAGGAPHPYYNTVFMRGWFIGWRRRIRQSHCRRRARLTAVENSKFPTTVIINMTTGESVDPGLHSVNLMRELDSCWLLSASV